jgi:HYDIN/CFA65/VesB family protein/centrosomal CEP192-like protein
MGNQGSVLERFARSAFGGVYTQPLAHVRRNAAWLSTLLALVALAYTNGCAGVVGASPNTSNNSGSSGSPGPPPAPALAATPTTVSFPNVVTGTSNSQTITLSNAGTANVTVSQVTVSGAGFGITGLTAPLTIAPVESATFNVVFAPSASGNATGSVVLTSNAPNSPLTIAISGSATTLTRLLNVSPTSLSFGNVMVGNNSTLSAALTNAGNSDVTISGVTAAGPGFAATGSLTNVTLSAGQTAALNVSFAPTTVGSAAGSLTINSNATTPAAISLAGTGVQASTHSVVLTWDPSTSTVVGYYVYRGLAGSGAYSKLNTTPVAGTEFTDSNVASGQMYEYVVTAVDADNVESAYSNAVDATIP